ncbi:hypothetical protein SY88_20975 [Clostridiales bacterium PH28_bin88]|nr:hypothetical protein SY88_20975 [Clostridiales bacterium PH28_bin88]
MKKLLIQLDSDDQASVFDQVVAYDAGVDHVISLSGVRREDVTPLVHGAMFTRGGDKLKNTAIFIGGSDVTRGEELLAETMHTFFGPVRVSVMHDSNGCNTTAAAMVKKIAGAVEVRGEKVAVLGGSGPVGARAAVLLAGEGAEVLLFSRQMERAEATCLRIAQVFDEVARPCAAPAGRELAAALSGVQVVVAAGKAGVQLLAREDWSRLAALAVMADVNAVPPAGIEGVEMMDDGKERDGKTCFGPIAIGNLKMRIHRRCIRELFSRNDLVLGVKEIYRLAGDVGAD